MISFPAGRAHGRHREGDRGRRHRAALQPAAPLACPRTLGRTACAATPGSGTLGRDRRTRHRLRASDRRPACTPRVGPARTRDAGEVGPGGRRHWMASAEFDFAMPRSIDPDHADSHDPRQLAPRPDARRPGVADRRRAKGPWPFRTAQPRLLRRWGRTVSSDRAAETPAGEQRWPSSRAACRATHSIPEALRNAPCSIKPWDATDFGATAIREQHPMPVHVQPT